ncbi:MAG: hypothetical protein JOZ52_10725 [Acidobacteria bacterium]|nr:hypothetical protein [Acidobacteriota bacterium]
MSFLDRFRRKKVEDEATRRSRLLRTGRITEGAVLDIVCDDAGAATEIFFTYSINGVDYEASQTLTPEQRGHQHTYAPGASITVRYDPHRPGNSVVV